MEYRPLVSVIVVTYNSSGSVRETLESIKAQTYDNIELIVTDDCSADNTIEVVEDWLNGNGVGLVSTAVVRSGKNTGIPANCNRGLNGAKGKYVKFIAGDDLLLENCIAFDVCGIGNAMVLSTAMLFKRGNILVPSPDPSVVPAFFKKSGKAQIKRYLRRPIFLNTPSLFFRRDIFKEIGVFDERIELLEDQPFICKLLTSGYSIKYADHVTVIYRLNTESVTGRRNKAFLECQHRCYKYYIRPFLKITNFIDLLVITESVVVFFLEKRDLNRGLIYKSVIRYRPSRFFVEDDFLSKAFSRVVNYKRN